MNDLIWTCSIIVTGLVLGGCTRPHSSDEQTRDAVGVSVEGSVYAAGDSIERRLTNGTDGSIGYNLCFATLERRTEEGWTAVQDRDPDNDGRAEAYRAVQRMLAAGGTATDTALLPVDLEAGTYRFTVEVEWPDGRTQVARTGRFVVRE
jgi:hypothetical protein